MKPVPDVFSAGLRRVSVPWSKRPVEKYERAGKHAGPVINQPERLKRLESSFPLFLCGIAAGRCLLFRFPGHRCQPFLPYSANTRKPPFLLFPLVTSRTNKRARDVLTIATKSYFEIGIWKY